MKGYVYFHLNIFRELTLLGPVHFFKRFEFFNNILKD